MPLAVAVRSGMRRNARRQRELQPAGASCQSLVAQKRLLTKFRWQLRRTRHKLLKSNAEIRSRTETFPMTQAPTAAAAARFLAQASLGASRAGIAQVQAQDYAGWIDAQLAAPRSGTRWDWLVSKGYNDLSHRNSQAGFDACAWRKLISAPDTLRQRVTLALSEICVVAIEAWSAAGAVFRRRPTWTCWKTTPSATTARCWAISLSTAMGQYLTYRGNVKQNPATGALPDENYARELMQLFTIGLLQLNADGTPVLVRRAQETYGLDDITGLARVFTGWDLDDSGRRRRRAPTSSAGR
jgi:uncharacterized protein (DUF1800 family)